MIKSFKDYRAEMLHLGELPKGFSPDLAKRTISKLYLLDTVTRIEDSRIPPGNQLHALKGNRAGQWAIRINDQFRLCFAWRDNNAYDVEIVDYH